MRNVISRDRVAGQFRAAADAVLQLAIQEERKTTNSIARIPAHVTGEEETLIPDTPHGNRLAACGNRPGEVVCALAGQLAAAGFDVGTPTPNDERHLTIRHTACARCELVVDDDGSMRWEYRPVTGPGTDPAVMTQAILHVLAPDDTAEPDASTHPGVTLKGAVGQALDALGLDVQMLVYEDLISYDVAAEIVVTNPARPDRGQVRLSDDGSVTWACSYRDVPSGKAEQIAVAVVSVVTKAIALSRSATRKQPGDLH
jgi:hypothetical protein